jgi:hypothetical protein
MTILTGGCQCGAVRYTADVIPKTAHLCHCRMCQKAAGNYFMPLASAPKATFEASGEISWFQSSEPVRRGFCAKCGTPLIYDPLGSSNWSVTLGSLDNPAAAAPTHESGIEARMPWFDPLPGVHQEVSGASETDGGARLELIERSSRQHPDHD